MRINRLSAFICSLAFLAGCSKQEVYEIPTQDGKVVITGISKSTSNGISTLDDSFTVNVTFATAKPGDVMKVELLKLQTPEGASTAQLLPLTGTQKEVTVGDDLKASATFTRAEAQMSEPSDYVTVIFAGKTDYAKLRVDMAAATTVSAPKVGDKEIEVMRSNDVAFVDVNVSPKSGAYTGPITVRRKNGTNAPWVNVGTGTFTSPAKVPVSGADFAAGQDTMIYSFRAQQGNLVDEVTSTIIVRDPYFFLKKSGTLSQAIPTQGGMNVITNTPVAANAADAIIALGGTSLNITGGTTWATNGKAIQFVPSTLALYDRNNSGEAITAFEAGAKSASADPIVGEGVFIFKAVNGPNPEDIFYGMIKVVRVVPGVSVEFEYRIGNLYAHQLVIK